MRVFSGGRRSGKTTEAVRLASAGMSQGVYLVTHSHAAARASVDLAHSEGLDIHFPLTYGELARGGLGPGVRAVIIDNAEFFIQQFTDGRPLHAVAINDDPREFDD